MDSSVFQIALYLLGGCSAGVLAGWWIRGVAGRRRFGQLASVAQKQLDDVASQRDEITGELYSARSKIEKLEASNARRRSELKSLVKKSKLLAGNVRTLRTERENTKAKVGKIQHALVSLRKKSTALQKEFDKSRDFYKRELQKSFEKRKTLEEEVKQARAEQENFARQVESSILEHGSPENMITAAQLRLGQLEVLERNVSKLEAENAQLRQDAVDARQQFDARERDLKEMEELRLHNRQLVQCVEALESSRQASAEDAERYREQADQSEKESDTLRLKLEDLEKNFADIEEQQHSALEDARNETVVPILRKQS